jgi:hypothetical protein
MINNLINFVWILVGAETDLYIGEQKKYCLVEYSVNNDSDSFSLKLSNFTTKLFPWKPLDELNYAETLTVNKMIDDGKRFLYKVDNDKYAYICNILDGKYIFNDEENINIKNKLKELIYKTYLSP